MSLGSGRAGSREGGEDIEGGELRDDGVDGQMGRDAARRRWREMREMEVEIDGEGDASETEKGDDDGCDFGARRPGGPGQWCRPGYTGWQCGFPAL